MQLKPSVDTCPLGLMESGGDIHNKSWVVFQLTFTSHTVAPKLLVNPHMMYDEFKLFLYKYDGWFGENNRLNLHPAAGF